MARRFTYNKPLVKETKGDKTIYYFADENPFDAFYDNYSKDGYIKGNYFASNMRFRINNIKEFLVGMFDYIFKKIRI